MIGCWLSLIGEELQSGRGTLKYRLRILEGETEAQNGHNAKESEPELSLTASRSDFFFFFLDSVSQTGLKFLGSTALLPQPP